MKIKREGGEWSWINFQLKRVSTFCFVCGRIGHLERDCSVVYANPGKEIERVYGTWLRAPNKNARTSNGSRWLRNGKGRDHLQETGETSKMQADGGEAERNAPKFTDDGKDFTEKQEDNGRITVTERNQELKDSGGQILNGININGGNNRMGNYVLDPKRRRTEQDTLLEENEAEIMQTDRPDQLNQNKGENVSKNLIGLGSGNQAHLVL